MSRPIEIFCCVAETDQSYLSQLVTQLAAQQQSDIKLWDKSQIPAGANADEEIHQHLDRAHIFLLLISPDFLVDDYCYKRVMRAALGKHVNQKAITIPVIVRPVHWKKVPLLNTIQAVPRSGKPISGQRDQDKAFWEVANEIDKAIQKLREPLIESGPYGPYPRRDTGKISSPTPGNKQKRMGVLLVLIAVLIIFSGGIALALFVNHPGSSSGVPPASTRGSVIPTQQPSLKWANPPGVVDSSPTVANGVLYVGSNDYYVYALYASTGQQKWAFRTSGRVESSPAVVNGVVYVGSQDHKMYALDASTGQQKWAFTTGNRVDSSSAIVNGVVYVGSADHNVYALDANTGQQKWAFTTGSAVGFSPTVVNGVLYVASLDNNVYALDANTGQQKWTVTGGSSSPAVVNGVVYIGSGDHNVYALDANTGQRKWVFPTGGAINSLPAVVNGVLYVGSCDHNVYAVDIGTGQQKWAFPTGGCVLSSPTVVNGVLYVGSGDGSVTPDDHNVYALDASTGQQKWVFPTGGYVRCSPKIFDGVLYFGSGDGNMYALTLSLS